MKILIVYAMGFNLVIGQVDFESRRADPAFLSIPHEQARAIEAGTLSADVVAEQKKLKAADLLILQFPIWWFGMPAIMKGWAERAFVRGFAYSSGLKYEAGMFRGKLAMVSTTTGTSADTYAPDGIDSDVLSVL